MRAFYQILKLELISAIRSKTMLVFAIASTLWMILGRYLLKGEASGMYQLSVRYLLGLLFSLVLISLGAAAAGALSSDRVNKRLQLSMIRPVPHFVIAMARSVAITLIGSLVLLFALVVLWAFEGRDKSCARVYSPKVEEPRKAAEEAFRKMIEAPDAKSKDLKAKVAEFGEEPFIKYLEDYIRDEYVIVQPNTTESWVFDGVPEGAKNIGVRVRFVNFMGIPGSVLGDFTFRDFTGAINKPIKSRFYLPLDSTISTKSEASPNLSFTNKTDIPLRLRIRKDLHLLVDADSFAWNAFRSWLVMTFVLMIVVSLGVFFGACLGRGVAVFSVISLLIAMTVSPTTIEDYPNPAELNFVSYCSLRISEFSAIVTSPVSKFSPISSLEESECIEWSVVGEAIMAGVFYLLLFSFLSGFTMSRKQE